MDIEKWIESFNKTVPQRYFKRNVPQYTLVTYINHSLILFKGRKFSATYIFLKRASDFLDEKGDLKIDKEYTYVLRRYLSEMNDYLTNNNLIDEKLLNRFKIKN